MSMALYRPGVSPVHRVPPGAKLLVLLAAAVLSARVATPLPLLGGVAVVGGLYVLARVPARVGLRQVRPALSLLALVLLAHGLTGGWTSGLVVVLRVAVVLLLAVLLSLTTRVSDLVDLLERGLRPLARFGVRPARVALVLALAIRFVPVLAQQADEVRAAQRARGLERLPLALLVPLLIKTLRLADRLGDALDARGFDS